MTDLIRSFRWFISGTSLGHVKKSASSEARRERRSSILFFMMVDPCKGVNHAQFCCGDRRLTSRSVSTLTAERFFNRVLRGPNRLVTSVGTSSRGIGTAGDT